MLINVFGRWINPASIEQLEKITTGTNLYFTVSEYAVYFIKDKTPDEVANEINRLLKENK